MTVIAFKDNVMAADTRVSNPRAVSLGNVQKIWYTSTKSFGEGLLGVVGNIYLLPAMKSWVEGHEFVNDSPWDNNYFIAQVEQGLSTASAVFIPNKQRPKDLDPGAFNYFDGVPHRPIKAGETVALIFDYQYGGPVSLLDSQYAFGDGDSIALAAMKRKATATEAVALAMELLPGTCGGEVMSLHLHPEVD